MRSSRLKPSNGVKFRAIAFAVALSSGLAISFGIDIATPAATKLVHQLQPQYPDGKCFDYAIKLSQRLPTIGIHGRLIFYSWRIVTDKPDSGELCGSHVIAVYRAGNKEFVSDNEHRDPIEVPAGAPDIQIVYTLGADRPAPVEIALNEEMNRMSYF